MTDRELLEAAAKAAGLTIHSGHQAGRDACGAGDMGLWIINLTTCWNPLIDDGDALGLAVQLRMVVEIGRDATLVYQDDPGICQIHEGDPAAATRRAIVWFAATKAGQGELVLPNV